MIASRLNITFSVISLACCVPFILGVHLPAGFDGYFLLVSLLLTGIPHGAIDHVIYKRNQQLNGQKYTLLRSFFVPYLCMITITFGLWMLVPELMFWFFLLVAAYHFGQSQLYYVALADKPYLKAALYITWGILLLAMLWLLHWQAQGEIIRSLFDWDLHTQGALYNGVQILLGISACALLTIMVVMVRRQYFSLKMAMQEILVLICIAVLFMLTPLYVSFAVYFGLWHATRVIITEYRFIYPKKRDWGSLMQFVYAFLPFSLLSFAGLALLFWVSQWLKSNISPFMLFLIFISALTMPHAFFMEQMYRLLGKNASREKLSLT